MKTILFSADYDEGNQASFRAFEIRMGESTYRFDTGDAVVDYVHAMRYVMKLMGEDFPSLLVRSSSVDSFFFMDGDTYFEKGFDADTGEWVAYVTDSTPECCCRAEHRNWHDVKAHVRQYEEGSAITTRPGGA